MRNVTITISGAPMPIDAYKAAIKDAYDTEKIYENNTALVTDVSAVVSVLEGTTPFRIFVFNKTLVKATGTYTYAFLESAANVETSVTLNPEPEPEP